MSVGVTTQPSFSASMPRIVADMPPKVNSDYDVSPDGQRFLFVKSNVEKGPLDEVRVVLNWTEELKNSSHPQASSHERISPGTVALTSFPRRSSANV